MRTDIFFISLFPRRSVEMSSCFSRGKVGFMMCVILKFHMNFYIDFKLTDMFWFYLSCTLRNKYNNFNKIYIW